MHINQLIPERLPSHQVDRLRKKDHSEHKRQLDNTRTQGVFYTLMLSLDSSASALGSSITLMRPKTALLIISNK